MPRPVALLAWGALAAPPAAAWLKNPWLKSAAEESWKPAAETGLTNAAAADDHQLALGWSPRPTEAPALYARMDLVERMDGYTLGSDTCGFIENGNSFTCITAGETCSFSSGYIGCCSTTSCNVVRTTCIDYDASSAGECDLPDDFHTLCCGTSSIGACFTYVLSTTGSGDESDGTFTLLGCAASTGTSTLFDYDPAWASTHSVASDSTTASESDESSTTASETETSAAATTTADDDDDDDSGPPVGAIAGGAVGGVALLALVGLAIFFILRKKRAAKNQQPPPPPPPANQAAVPPPMSQQQHQQQQQPPPMSPQSPQSFAPSSPSGTLYPSGVPSNFQGYSPQQGTPLPYDPNMNAYGQQAYSPQPGYNGQGYAPPPPQGYPPQDFQQQGFQQHQQGFQQQGQYNQYGAVPAYAPPSSTSLPPNMTPSPAPKESEPVYGGQQQQQQQHQHHHSPPQDAQELPVIHPVGNEGNRAELS